jgi:aryl-alcohol dehydrogenase-like predicted oxidoreductase
MEYRQLGNSGLRVSALSFGTGTFGGAITKRSDQSAQTIWHKQLGLLIATETGKTVPQIALNWLLDRPTVASLIVGARNEEQLRQNLDSVGWKLTAEQTMKLDAASATPPAYPAWFQRTHGAERNPALV